MEILSVPFHLVTLLQVPLPVTRDDPNILLSTSSKTILSEESLTKTLSPLCVPEAKFAAVTVAPVMVRLSPVASPNVVLPSMVKVPLALILPDTVSFSAGLDVPIPNAPSSANTISSPF